MAIPLDAGSIGVTLISLILVVVISRKIKSQNVKLPPGPPGLPILGNIFQMGHKVWHSFHKMKDTYGPVMHLNMAGTPFIIINSSTAAADLLDRRAANYSDRPRSIVAGEYISRGHVMPFARYGDQWRTMRRASHMALKPTICAQYHPVQTDEACLLTHDMLKDPENWLSIMKRSTASFVTSTIYDMPPLKDPDDPIIQVLSATAGHLAAASFPGAYLVEILPILDYAPRWLSKWKRDAEAAYELYTSRFENFYNNVKSRVNNGDQRSSFCATLAETSSQHKMSDRQCAWLAATIYLAGFDTTATVMSWFMACMVLHPEVQQKAQAEIDRVVGRDRLPTFADLELLPYIRAIMKEVQRWRPVTPLGFPHATLEDDWYEGYLIPKGSTVLANIWSMNRDPEIFGPDADKFNPDRYLDEDGNLKNPQDEGHFTYGFGRRVCVGRYLANNALFIDISTLLWASVIEPTKGEDDQPILPDLDQEESEGVFTRPLPFPCNIRLRFPDAEMILQQAREAVLVNRPG